MTAREVGVDRQHSPSVTANMRFGAIVWKPVMLCTLLAPSQVTGRCLAQSGSAAYCLTHFDSPQNEIPTLTRPMSVATVLISSRKPPEQISCPILTPSPAPSCWRPHMLLWQQGPTIVDSQTQGAEVTCQGHPESHGQSWGSA